MVLVRSLLTGGIRSSSQSRGSIRAILCCASARNRRGAPSGALGPTELVEPVVANSWVLGHSLLACFPESRSVSAPALAQLVRVCIAHPTP